MKVSTRINIRTLADGTQERTETPVDVDDAEVKAGKMRELREKLWASVDIREAIAGLAVVVGALAGRLTEEERAPIAEALAYVDRVTTTLAGWGDLEAVVDAARDYDEVQQIVAPPVDMRPPRAAELAKAVRAARRG